MKKALIILILAFFSATLQGCTKDKHLTIKEKVNPCFVDAPKGIIEMDLHEVLSSEVTEVIGFGMTYMSHIEELSGKFDSNKTPPIFRKSIKSLNLGSKPVKLPSKEEIIKQIKAAENDITEKNLKPGTKQKVKEKGKNFVNNLKNFDSISPLLDWEAELAFILLEEVTREQLENSKVLPKIGFFFVNDLSCRAIAALDDPTDEDYTYWGYSKSFEGFLPVGKKLWIVEDYPSEALICGHLSTLVIGEGRSETPVQNEYTANLLYSPKEMLTLIMNKYERQILNRGLVVMTGTPGGCAIEIGWIEKMVGRFISAESRLRSLLRKGRKTGSGFLKAGDKVKVTGSFYCRKDEFEVEVIE